MATLSSTPGFLFQRRDMCFLIFRALTPTRISAKDWYTYLSWQVVIPATLTKDYSRKLVRTTRDAAKCSDPHSSSAKTNFFFCLTSKSSKALVDCKEHLHRQIVTQRYRRLLHYVRNNDNGTSSASTFACYTRKPLLQAKRFTSDEIEL